MQLRVGFSADPDDAFMMWALDAGRVDTRGFSVEPVVSDIQTLNEWALEGRLEVTPFSSAAYAQVADRYRLLTHGASFGEGYGPMVVAREPLTLDELRRTEIAIPGRLTTAYLGLRLALGTDDLLVRELPFDQVLPEVVEGRAVAGLIIHEGQLTYEEHGLVKILDTGEWWQAETGLPLPLSLVAVRRDVDRAEDVSAVLRDAIRTGLAHREEAMRYALEFGRGIDAKTADEFVGMYVNDLTQDMGDRGKAAVAEILRRVGSPVQPEFVD
ncbi:MAG TPA: MqnA/MqnD/SBP family protein [Gaiellaceae bacterium]|nr:MqnA/MqnD/SBP family protein [Gaiellaceae bacterium]